MRKVCLILFSLLLLSCGKKKSSFSKEDPFIHEIRSTSSKIKTVSNTYLNNKVFSPLRLDIGPKGRMFVPSGSDNKIYLKNKKDSIIAQAGGNGRGPGKFNTINEVFIDNSLLYVIDRMLRRVTIFKIQDEKIIYNKSLSLKNNKNLKLYDIYTNEKGIWGIFNRVDNYQSGKNTFHLYKLNEDFEPKEHLLEIRGNEKISMSQGMHIDHPLGTSISWDFHKGWFYYIASDKLEMTKFNLSTDKKETLSLHKSVDRQMTSNSRKYFKKRLQPVIKSVPEVKEAINKKKTVPKLDGLVVEDNSIIFKTFFAGDTKGLLLITDKKLNNVKTVETPPHYRIYAKRDQILYGIDFTVSGEPKVMLMTVNTTN